ncbi:MAG: zf-HC2 domain-containing protein [Candidatus Aminicenantes bacterium]
MTCKNSERLLLRSLDGLLTEEEKRKLASHLESCSACQAKKREYGILLAVLKKKEYPEPKPYFRDRLQGKIKERQRYNLWNTVKQWSLKAVPLSLVIVLILAFTLIFMPSPKKEELSQSELLLRHRNPLQDERLLLEEESENQNMMIIFSSLEEEDSVRRYIP